MNADDLRMLSSEAQRSAIREQKAKLEKERNQHHQSRLDQARKVIQNLPQILTDSAKTGSRSALLLILEHDEIQYAPAYERGWFGTLRKMPACVVVVSVSDHVQEIIDACKRLGCNAEVRHPSGNRRPSDGPIGNPWLEASW